MELTILHCADSPTVGRYDLTQTGHSKSMMIKAVVDPIMQVSA